jgi:hypothetical protein
VAEIHYAYGRRPPTTVAPLQSFLLLSTLDTEGKKSKGLRSSDLGGYAKELPFPILFMVAKWRQNRIHVNMEYFVFDHRIHPLSYDTYF